MQTQHAKRFTGRQIATNTLLALFIGLFGILVVASLQTRSKQEKSSAAINNAEKGCVSLLELVPKNSNSNEKLFDIDILDENFYRCIKPAAQGDSLAQLNMGYALYYGIGTERNPTEGIKWLKKSAEQNNAQAQFLLGTVHTISKYVPQDTRAAIAWFDMAAKQGHTEAQYNLFSIYWSEKLQSPQHAKKALHWLKKSAQAGLSEAQTTLGLLHLSGQISSEVDDNAILWLTKAGEQDSLFAQFFLAIELLQNGKQTADAIGAAKWLKKVASYDLQNNPMLINDILDFSNDSADGLIMNDDSVAFLDAMDKEKDIREMVANSQYLLAVLYLEGNGIEKDPGLSVKWLRKSANLDNVEAQLLLGALFNAGGIVPKNDAEALKWFMKGAQLGDAVAQYGVANIYSNGQETLLDNHKALSWCQKSAEHGFVPAQYQLALMYFQGQGTMRSNIEGYKWLLIAEDSSFANASQFLSQEEVVVLQQFRTQIEQADIQRAKELAQDWAIQDGQMHF